MFDKNSYLKVIEHAKGTEKSSNVMAFKIDDEDGIAEHIGFKGNMISKVDYFLEYDSTIVLIELSDLRQELITYGNTISGAFEKIAQEDIKPKYKREKQIVAKKQAWKGLRDEFSKKWNGSIAVIERLYRKTNKPADVDPKYNLLIVCKNETDIEILDGLVNQLNGMMGENKSVQICKTETLNQILTI
jgi:uncharacterized protein YktA (UPF0223 family)